MVTSEQLQEYLEFLKATDIEELEVAFNDGERLRLKRGEVAAVCAAPAAVVAAPPPAAGGSSAVPSAAAPARRECIVKSPLVGRFLKSSSKDHPPFVVDGENVQAGQKLAFVEAMKILRDVVSPCAGVVRKVLVEDGQFVEYGQGLFIIEPAEDLR
jgi:acetyl-CoA carboxylase biotin carboxyl carrier protein